MNTAQGIDCKPIDITDLWDWATAIEAAASTGEKTTRIERLMASAIYQAIATENMLDILELADARDSRDGDA